MIQLSVIIPTRNRAETLKRALESITTQAVDPCSFEVIVVDNGSADKTRSIVGGFSNAFKNLVYIYDERPGLHIGRHRGLLASRGNILVYGDDDIEALPTWLEGIKESFDDESVVLVGGKNMPNFESAPPKWISEMWESGGQRRVLGYLSILDFGDEFQEIDPYFVFGCNFSIRKDILLEARGFHPDGMPQELIKYRGDGESHVSKFIASRGYKAVYNPKASVYHLCSTARMSKDYFMQRAFNQGISDSYTALREGQRGNILKLRIKIAIKKYLLGRDEAIQEAFVRGYKYHQREVERDPKLREWVMRSDYIENGGIK